ncbi:hypothetical protein J0H58_00090 [bacterium]|nr:hypothetical protein [bacterium]
MTDQELDVDERPADLCPSARVTAAAALVSGLACLLGSLTVAGGVAAVLLDAVAGGVGDGGGCMGACVLPALMLACSAGLGALGAGLSTLGGILFWRLTAGRPVG